MGAKKELAPGSSLCHSGGPLVSGAAGSKEWRCRSRSPAETDRLGRALGRALRCGDVVALYGELGTGKTSFVRGMAVGLGAPARRVSSPTFVLIHEYRGRLPLVHADLYRMDNASELEHLGLSDYLDDRHVVAIEWADKAGHELPEDRLEVYLRHRGQDLREIVMKATGSRAQAVLSRLAKRGEADRDLQPVRATEHDRR